MKNVVGLLIVAMVLMTAAWECSVGESKITSFKTTKDKEGKTDASTFKAGDTLYAIAEIGGSSKTTTKFWVTDEKGTAISTETKVELARNGTATYSLPLPGSAPGGKYTVHAEMTDEKGEKKDTKTAAVTIEGGAAPAKSDDKKKKEEAGEDDEDEK